MTDAVDGRGSEAESDGSASTQTLDRPLPTDPGGAAGVPDADGDGSGPDGAASDGGPRHPVHRLRDLSRSGKVWAALFTVGLLLAPALAFAWAAPDWAPANDPALMGLRVLDVGTSATPLTGQPSTSTHYVGGERPVDHPGPIHFYVMKPFVEALGISIGMITTSVLITGGCVLISAWAVFRQLGRGAGVAAAVALGAITFTTGASSLVNPVSSNIAGYPVLCSMVMLWCLVCGDVRLLPLAAAVVSFAAQQHLSVLPSLVAALCLTLAVAALGQWRMRHRPEAPTRREWARWGGGALAVSLVLWAPVLLQEVLDRPGNLTLMAKFAGNSDRGSVGLSSASDQLVNTLSLTHLLFRTNLDGATVIEAPTTATYLSAAVVVAVLVALAVWWRRTHPRRTLLVASIGIVAVSGVVNGSSVPDSLEQLRLPFYHWTFALSLLILVALALGIVDIVKRLVPAPTWALARPALAGVGLVALVTPAVINPSIDRRSNTLAAAYSPVKRSILAELADEIAAHRDDMGDDVLLVSRGGVYLDGVAESVNALLADGGTDLKLATSHRYFVDDEHLTDRASVDGGVLVVQETLGSDYDAPGKLIAEVTIVDGVDIAAYDTLVDQAEAYGASLEGKVATLSPEVRAEFPNIAPEALDVTVSGTEPSPDDVTRLLRSMSTPESTADVKDLVRVLDIPGNPTNTMADPAVLQVVVDHPDAVPYLDPATAERLLRTLPEDFQPDHPLRLRAHQLSRSEVLATASSDELR